MIINQFLNDLRTLQKKLQILAGPDVLPKYEKIKSLCKLPMFKAINYHTTS